jgi:hypothetical protein
VDQAGKAKIEQTDDPTFSSQATVYVLSNERCGLLQPVGCAFAGVL